MRRIGLVGMRVDTIVARLAASLSPPPVEEQWELEPVVSHLGMDRMWSFLADILFLQSAF